MTEGVKKLGTSTHIEKSSEESNKINLDQIPISKLVRQYPSDGTDIQTEQMRVYWIQYQMEPKHSLPPEQTFLPNKHKSRNITETETESSNYYLEGQLEKLFSNYREEHFEVGIESQFSKDLQCFCNFDPITTLRYLTKKIFDSDIESEVLAEALRWASRQKAFFIRDQVVNFLSAGLHASSSLERDEAALGLASLEEEKSISLIKSAIKREPVPELRKDMEDLIHSLKS